MLSGMFSFMKKTSRVRHNPESEGIYLSDLNAEELDPEVAALYFPSSHRGTNVVKGTQCFCLFCLTLTPSELESVWFGSAIWGCHFYSLVAPSGLNLTGGATLTV